MIVACEVMLGRMKRLPEMVETFRVGADEVKNTLLGVSECDERALYPEGLDDMPLLCARILKLIKDNERIHRRDQGPDLIRSMEKIADLGREEVKADLSFLACQALPFGFFSLFFLCFLFIRQLRGSFISTTQA
ncbi:MAG: hypothetical protein BGP12_12875 [Rhodospirillales bacterium 70-18]|nr:MAG: hypothetical protein BGP12_12875 [Rhodospirillales bacterium 70-18]